MSKYPYSSISPSFFLIQNSTSIPIKNMQTPSQSSSKQNRNTYSLHLKHKQPSPLSKKYIVLAPQATRNPFNSYLFQHKTTTSNSSVHLAKKSEVELSGRNVTHPPVGRNDGQWKKKRIEGNNHEKYVPFKNDERIKEIFSTCKEYLAPNTKEQNHQTTESSQNQRRSSRNKQESISKLLLDCSHPKKNSFTINMKQLRKKNKKQGKSDTMNCRVVNLFESIEKKIQPIHQHETGNELIKNISLKDYLGKISQTLDRVNETEELEKDHHAVLHPMQTEHFPQSDSPQAHPRTNVKAHRERRERNSRKQPRSYEVKEFQLKPWSTREIVIDL